MPGRSRAVACASMASASRSSPTCPTAPTSRTAAYRPATSYRVEIAGGLQAKAGAVAALAPPGAHLRVRLPDGGRGATGTPSSPIIRSRDTHAFDASRPDGDSAPEPERRSGARRQPLRHLGSTIIWTPRTVVKDSFEVKNPGEIGQPVRHQCEPGNVSSCGQDEARLPGYFSTLICRHAGRGSMSNYRDRAGEGARLRRVPCPGESQVDRDSRAWLGLTKKMIVLVVCAVLGPPSQLPQRRHYIACQTRTSAWRPRGARFCPRCTVRDSRGTQTCRSSRTSSCSGAARSCHLADPAPSYLVLVETSRRAVFLFFAARTCLRATRARLTAARICYVLAIQARGRPPPRSPSRDRTDGSEINASGPRSTLPGLRLCLPYPVRARADGCSDHPYAWTFRAATRAVTRRPPIAG
jgi:hypothetical protein